MSANIIARMGECLPTVYRGALEWLLRAEKYKPLRKALDERFGTGLTHQRLGQWLTEHVGDTTEDGMVLSAKYSANRHAWRYRVGQPPPVVEHVPSPLPMTEEERQAHVRAMLKAMTPPPKPKPIEMPRQVARFVSTNIVDGPSGSKIANPEPVTALPIQPEPIRQSIPYVPIVPPGFIVTRVPEPRRPGVNYNPNGTRTPKSGYTSGWSPLDA